jgi:hypothetical protein
MVIFALWAIREFALENSTSLICGMPLCSEQILDSVDYDGEVLCISSWFRSTQKVSLKGAHVEGEAASLWCDKPLGLPLPFLLTNDLRMQPIFDSDVVFEPNNDYARILSKVQCIPVMADGWIGVVRTQRRGFFKRKVEHHLIAFGSNLNASFQVGVVFSPAWPEARLGQIGVFTKGKEPS